MALEGPVTSPLRQLPAEARRSLVTAIRGGRIATPFTELTLRRYVGAQAAGPLAEELSRLVALGMTPELLAEVLTMLDATPLRPRTELVWTGPEESGAETRDTGVVLRELFGGAERRVLVAGYAVHQGPQVLDVLAERMDALPELDVKMFLNVPRAYGDTTAADALVYEFAKRFRTEVWPGQRRPVVYYDPRSVEVSEPGRKRAVLHAKCVVADDKKAFVTSANLTEAAQVRNIEVGVLLHDSALARTLAAQLESLVAHGHVRSLPGL